VQTMRRDAMRDETRPVGNEKRHSSPVQLALRERSERDGVRGGETEEKA